MTGRGDIQGNILRGYGSHTHAAYVFTRVARPGAARAMLGRLVRRVASERDWAQFPPSRLNVAFTHAGLEALGAPVEPFAGYEDFRAGMYARARTRLGDLGANDPAHWDVPLTDRAHVLFIIYGHDQDTRDGEVARLCGDLPAAGMDLVHLQFAAMRRGAREHFGFRDGFSQPALAGVSTDRRSLRGEGAARRAWRRLLGDQWRPIRLGEFVLGHRDEDGIVPGAGHPLLRNGTFMVWRKLEQDVAGFDEWVRAWAGPDHWAQDLLKARIVGRWQHGASLVRRPPDGRGGPPRGADRDRDATQPEINDFVYAGDAEGLRCPLGAHVRRAYPRDALGFRTERTRRNRIIRRGMPYADEEPPSRGLIFVCFNASIARQFEQIQGNWLMSGDTFGLGDDRDFLTGGLDDPGDLTKLTIQGNRASPPAVVTRDRQFVTVRGGYYLFVPGLRALRMISEGG
jgi:Dyp-type peroxidase family